MTNDSKVVLVVTAHDDDMVIAIGGTLLNRHSGSTIYHVVCTTGENSHAVVFGEADNPSPEQVKIARRQELINSDHVMAEAGLQIELDQLNFADTCGELSADLAILMLKNQFEHKLRELTPDVVYFHERDGHQDHKAVNQAMELALAGVQFANEAYTFSIWTKAVAAENPELDEADVPDQSDGAEVIDVEMHLDVKALALYAFFSQVQSWPYPHWPVQERAILLPKFLRYALRGEELITPWRQGS